MKIVDEFTGRILEGRRWSEGLHQAVEAKEGVQIKEENQTLATVTLQNYFRMYDKLSGMTGTANTEAGEFAHTYDLQVVSIPTNRPMVRADNADFIYKTRRREVQRRGRRHRRAPREGPAGARRHDLGREVGEALAAAREARHPARGAEREAARAGSRDRHPGRPAVGGHRRHEHGRPRRRHPPRRQSRGPGPPRVHPRRASTSARPSTRRATPSCFPRFEDECKVEGDKVRGIGGLYVLGTERHESRRIDNQLRGRSGRQGDPGESRFYLSLEDELMRLFATGLMQRVMDKSFDDDVPLESKMVSKAVERAQGTVEGRNFEIRKDVLKYDEVMNEQRKVIYRRRQQILDGEDLRDAALDAIESAIGRLVDQYCGGEFVEEWDTEGLLDDARTHFPTRVTKEQLDAVRRHAGACRSCCSPTRPRCTRRRKQSIGDETLRDIERRVMLSVIDQHWREHLYEMDYLQEGINLRAMGQQDPLSEWQREGFDMFEAMMGQIEDDFVQYVFHLQVVVDDEPQNPMRNVQYSAPTDPVQGSSSIASAMAAEAAADGRGSPTTAEADRRRRASRSRRSRCGSRRRPAATSRASAGAARSTSCATVAECATSPRTWLIVARRVRDAHRYLRIDEARDAARRARGRGHRRPSSGTTPTAPAR